MKRLLFFLFSIFIVTACKMGQYSQTSPMVDTAYLQIIATGKESPRTVLVYVDGNKPFEAKVNAIKPHTIKGDIYMVPKGKHKIKIMDNTNILYDSTVFLSLQETRQIQLP